MEGVRTPGKVSGGEGSCRFGRGLYLPDISCLSEKGRSGFGGVGMVGRGRVRLEPAMSRVAHARRRRSQSLSHELAYEFFCKKFSLCKENLNCQQTLNGLTH